MSVLSPESVIILPNTLYKVQANQRSGSGIQPAIEVQGGIVTIYGSFTKPVAPPTGMTIAEIGFEDIQPFAVLPTYLYITGAPTQILLYGISAVVVV